MLATWTFYCWSATLITYLQSINDVLSNVHEHYCWKNYEVFEKIQRDSFICTSNESAVENSCWNFLQLFHAIGLLFVLGNWLCMFNVDMMYRRSMLYKHFRCVNRESCIEYIMFIISIKPSPKYLLSLLSSLN